MTVFPSTAPLIYTDGPVDQHPSTGVYSVGLRSAPPRHVVRHAWPLAQTLTPDVPALGPPRRTPVASVRSGCQPTDADEPSSAGL